MFFCLVGHTNVNPTITLREKKHGVIRIHVFCRNVKDIYNSCKKIYQFERNSQKGEINSI